MSTGAEGRRVARIQLSEEQRQQIMTQLGLEDRMERVPETVEIVRFHRDELDDVQGFALQLGSLTQTTLAQPTLSPTSIFSSKSLVLVDA
jgi:hypothetical protein